eukprot:CAMPEP_0197574652 /NCGR_PEP_ID=MMETSP1326-20131121/318_1 /TAXON_ID=1155430 /ORGANISM="Genus nov. species nov., Strain RCC2288" /LENGTH=40 /DNA_ID= /DNA_START= /DNA_END= /DNA_ORIENTATION=
MAVGAAASAHNSARVHAPRLVKSPTAQRSTHRKAMSSAQR